MCFLILQVTWLGLRALLYAIWKEIILNKAIIRTFHRLELTAGIGSDYIVLVRVFIGTNSEARIK
jgi:hypothetical protein